MTATTATAQTPDLAAALAKVAADIKAAAERHAAKDQNWAEAVNAMCELAADDAFTVDGLREMWTLAVQTFRQNGSEHHAALAVATVHAATAAAARKAAREFNAAKDAAVARTVAETAAAEAPAPRANRDDVNATIRTIPAGYYAVADTTGRVRFFKVEVGKKGTRWDGYRFVKEQAGDDLHKVHGGRATAVLLDIAKDPKTASAAYGHELGVCGVCSRTLTDPDSIAAGIGPICANKF